MRCRRAISTPPNVVADLVNDTAGGEMQPFDSSWNIWPNIRALIAERHGPFG
jgi:hypothetical protein